MANIDNVLKALHCCSSSFDLKCDFCTYYGTEDCEAQLKRDAKQLLEESQSAIGFVQTADSISFISTGDAQKGEERGMALGKLMMYEWIKKEISKRGLMTHELQSVFYNAMFV